MRVLKFEEVQEVNGGGDVKEFVNGACIAVTATGVFGWTVPGLNVAKGFCLGWKATELLID